MGNPKFVLYKQRVLERYNQLKELGLTVSYSFKTNNEVGAVLERITDCFFSVHSLKELEMIEDKKRVWYLLLNEENLEEVFSKGVRNFVVDLRDDLDKVLNLIKRKKEAINLLLRIKLKENTIFTGKYYVFGMESKEINDLIPELKKNEFIKKLGIHFHRKTQNVSEWNLKSELIEFLSSDSIRYIDIINIGGGIPGNYKNTSDKVVDFIFDKIRELKQWFNGEIIIEPGRFIASYAIDLECEIVAIRDNTIFVNFSVFNGAFDTLIYNIKLLVDGELEDGRRYIIKGSTPCSSDILRYEVFLKNPKVGDTIRFLYAGAYNYTTDFCCLEKIETIVV